MEFPQLSSTHTFPALRISKKLILTRKIFSIFAYLSTIIHLCTDWVLMCIVIRKDWK